MKRNILIKAYFKENLGDDLFLKVLFERYPETNWSLLDADEKYCKPFDDFDNVKTITFKDFFKRFWVFDGFINIGGSIFQQKNNKLGIRKRLLITTALNLINKKTFILGANFGPYQTEFYKKAYAFYFKQVSDVCFRDTKSFNLFKDNSNVRIAPDIVFGLKTGKVSKIDNSVGISIIDLSKRADLYIYEDIYIKKIVEIIEELDNKGKKIYLLSFCKEEGDENAINKLLSKLNNSIREKIELIFYEGNINEYLYKFQQIESIIACRFHSLILSQVFSQPVYPIIYSNKTKNVLDEMGFNEHYSFIRDLETIDLNKVNQALTINKIDVNNLLFESEKHFHKLDELLCKKMI